MSNNTLPKGAQHEIDFWKRFVQTEQFNTWLADGVTPELDTTVAEFIGAALQTGKIQVLDVASGVVSILNGLVPKNQLIAADVLGDEYRKLFSYKVHDILPPVAAPAERLPFADVFDIVHIRNGLDHCQDVMQAWRSIHGATKQGGAIIIQGFENEATAENWQGFHQHNLWVNKYDQILVDSKDGAKGVIGGAGDANTEIIFATRYALPNGKTWFVWIGKKL